MQPGKPGFEAARPPEKSTAPFLCPQARRAHWPRPRHAFSHRQALLRHSTCAKAEPRLIHLRAARFQSRKRDFQTERLSKFCSLYPFAETDSRPRRILAAEWPFASETETSYANSQRINAPRKRFRRHKHCKRLALKRTTIANYKPKSSFAGNAFGFFYVLVPCEHVDGGSGSGYLSWANSLLQSDEYSAKVRQMDLEEKLRFTARELIAAESALSKAAVAYPALQRPSRAFGRIARAANRPLRIGILGESNSGKSSLANLLVGVSTLPALPVANTRLPTLLMYARAPFVVGLYETGERVALSASERYPQGILKRLEVGLPSNLLRSVEILDFPGAANVLLPISRQDPAA